MSNQNNQNSVVNNTSVPSSFSHEQISLGHFNNMDGVSYDINNPLLKLRVIASSCFFKEPSYYNSQSHNSKTQDNIVSYLSSMLNSSDGYFSFENKDLRNLLEKQIDLALSYNAKETLLEAVRLRNEDNIRTTPQVIMVRAANHENVRGTSLIREMAPLIMRRTDEPAVQLEYQISAFGRSSIPNSLKRAWKSFLEGRTELQLAKYRLENKKVKTIDVVNLSHANSDEINKLAKGELKLSSEDSWEALIAKEGSNKKSWEKSIDLMGHMALLRNLRNFKKHELEMAPIYEKLINSAQHGKQLPFRYYSAAKALKDASSFHKKDTKAISDCIEISMGQMPKFNGRVMSLSDNSGSAHGNMVSEFGSVRVSEIANLSAIITAKNSDEGYVGVFGDDLSVLKINSGDDVFNKMDELENIAEKVGQATENGIWTFWNNAIKNKEHWDHIFIYSDMQAGHGGLYGKIPKEYENYIWENNLSNKVEKNIRRVAHAHIDVAKLIKDYRQKVNPDVHVYLVQVAGYADSLVPEFYDKTYILGGWNAGLFKFAHRMSQINELLSNKVALDAVLVNLPKNQENVNPPLAKELKPEKVDISSNRPKKRVKS